MENKKILDEERYQNTKRKIAKVALMVLIIGLLIGGGLITTGIINQTKVNYNYSPEGIAKLQKEVDAEKAILESKKNELETKRNASLNEEKQKLEAKKKELTDKGIKYDVFAKYDDGEKYDLYIITKVLDPSFSNCSFDQYKNNALTKDYCLIYNYEDSNSQKLKELNGILNGSCSFNKKVEYSKYCTLKEQLDKNSDIHRKSFESSQYIPFYMIGGFIMFTTLMISGNIYLRAKGREIFAFRAQQVLPVAGEGIEEIAPSIGKAGASIAKEMAPVYGEVAKEISKGIKEGLKDEK